MATSRIADHVGRVLGGRYRLLAPIGTGGSAHVFLAEDVTLRRRVAVKVLHAALAGDDSFLRRFRAEAQGAAALNHPNIMRVFDWGESDDGPYLVLEHLGGGSLRDLLDAGNRLSPSQALLVGLEAGRGLDYAHRRGLVHRDIKPANLLFDEEGRVAIADFGIARALAEAAWTEPAGALLGTARYASPEQARGLSVDGRSDVYSLALTLVEAVSGSVPFAADTTIATLMARTERSLEPPEVLGPLADAVADAGRVDPAERLDAAGLVARLDGVARRLPAPARLPLAGSGPIDSSRVVSPDDRTQIGKLFDREALRDDTPQDVAFLADEPERRRRWPRVALAVLVSVLLLAGAAFAIQQATTPSHPIPTLRGLTLAEARQKVLEEKFKVVQSSSRYEDGILKGQIVDQDPASGSRKEGSTIKVIVSKGPTPVLVPDLTNLNEAQAEAALKDSGLEKGNVTLAANETIAKGIILDWSGKGEKVPKGSAVELVVSSGPPPRTISNWKGKTFEEAEAGLKKAGLKVQRVDDYSDEVPTAGQVIRTDPGSGQSAEFGSTVKVYVSKGPLTVEVPRILGMTEDQAIAAIEAAGLTVGNRAGPSRGRVVAQYPEPGTKAKRGDEVGFILGGK